MAEEPVYNIGVMSRMTGIPQNTLRVWERRYNFPTPVRTVGGHRLYSVTQVARVRWVKQRIDEGMQTRNAIQALEQGEETGQYSDPARSLPSPVSSPASTADKTFREQLFEALIALDRSQAEMVLGQALAVHSLEHLVLTVIAPTFTAIGQAWEEGRISIATEHFATNYLRQKLQFWMQMAPPEFPVRPVVLACAPGELHEGGLLMLGLLLQRLRWPVVYLGQSVDIPDLLSFIGRIKPSMVVFVAMTEDAASALSQWPQWFPDKPEKELPVIAYAGYVFAQDSTWIERVPGVYLGNTLLDGLNTVNELLRGINPFPG
ncbi:MAG: MerR family transcriptional regulator [Anaerolineae bacterium]|nr:MerR family transcriptional regulator [Anaerolineae bacterium]